MSIGPFVEWFGPVTKHPGHPDQKVHGKRGAGNWSLQEVTDPKQKLALTMGDLGERAGDPLYQAIARRYANAHRIYTLGPHRIDVKTEEAPRVTDDDVKVLAAELEVGVGLLPEWRRYAPDGSDRPYRIVVSDEPSTIGASAFTYRGDDTIYISQGMARSGNDVPSGDDNMPVARSGQVSELRYTLVHELGHTTDLPGMPERAQITLERAVTAGGMSGYGRSDSQEGYAEAFTEWALGDRSNPSVQVYAEEYGWELSAAEYQGGWEQR